MASLMYGIRMRLARKPGVSELWEGILPMARQNAMAVSMVFCEVCNPAIISTPFCTGTGFMKCVLMTREEADVSLGSVVVDAAILVIEIEEVFVARMACGGQILASCEKIVVFREGISGTASITKSTSERADISVVVVRRERALSASSWVRRCLETSFSRSLSVERM